MFSIFANVGLLFIFKYYGFFVTNINLLGGWLHWKQTLPLLSIVLPIGLSFHTFQAMSYTIEVYRGHQKAEQHLGIYALYVLFYPQLVAGPIERPQNLLPQFHTKHIFDYAGASAGLKLMFWGFFKKIVIADRLAFFVDRVYTQPGEYYGIAVIIATTMFAFQIYIDFSSYTDIARGAAQVMGIKLMKNFDRPYFATTVRDFWNRWHISLSTWFRDYIYIPLGGNRVTVLRNCFNILVVFMISGLWHGANWTFVIWGALHSFYLLSSFVTRKIRSRFITWSHIEKKPGIHALMQTVVTFSLVSFAWIFFRANSVQSAFTLVGNIFKTDPKHLVGMDFVHQNIFLGQVGSRVFFTIALLAGLMTVEFLNRNNMLNKYFTKRPAVVRWGVYVVFFWVFIFLGQFGNNTFIYFVF